MEKYIGLKESGIRLDKDVPMFFNENKKFYKVYDNKKELSKNYGLQLQLTLKKNSEKFLDIEDNFDKYVEIYNKFQDKEEKDFSVKMAAYFTDDVEYIDMLDYDGEDKQIVQLLNKDVMDYMNRLREE